MRARTETALADVDPAAWDALVVDDDPFARHAYLRTLEDTGQVGPGQRWEPHHVTLRDDGGRLVGALPMYQKRDSWGEFVFDFAWANAFAQAGGRYYPKLVTAIPYTPVGGRRLLVAPGSDYYTSTATADRAIEFLRQHDAEHDASDCVDE